MAPLKGDRGSWPALPAVGDQRPLPRASPARLHPLAARIIGQLVRFRKKKSAEGGFRHLDFLRPPRSDRGRTARPS